MIKPCTNASTRSGVVRAISFSALIASSSFAQSQFPDEEIASKKHLDQRQAPIGISQWPTGRIVRVLGDTQDHKVTGDTLPLNAITIMLFTDEPCSLAIVGSKNMLRAWYNRNDGETTCWYATANYEFVTIDGSGRESRTGGYWQALPRVRLNANHTATITEPNYNSSTFLMNFVDSLRPEFEAHPKRP